MLRDANQVFTQVPYEYNAYLLARDGFRRRLDELVDLLGDSIRDGRLRRRLATVGSMVTVIGVGTALIWLLVGRGDVWPLVVPTLLVGGSVLLASWVSTWSMAPTVLDCLHTLIRPLAYVPGSVWSARRALIEAVEVNELAAQVRQRLNTLRRNRFVHDFGVKGNPELSEAFDSAYHVPTVVAHELDDLLSRLSAASIGLAGPRGAGKSTLIRRYCEEPAEVTHRGNLRCLVSAPVEYASRDFVLHLPPRRPPWRTPSFRRNGADLASRSRTGRR